MISSGMLQSESVRRWLGGAVPAWALLDESSFFALRHPPSAENPTIRLATDLKPAEVDQSAVGRNAIILLQAAAVAPGLKLTATGNLSRQVVAEMWELCSWPNFDKARALQLCKVINEPDFLPLFFLRHLLEGARLVKKRKGHLGITPTGRRALEGQGLAGLQGLLFETAFWRIDLGYFTRGLLAGWPQRDAGIVLWSLSVSAEHWLTPARLARLCTVPINGVLDQSYDKASYALEGTILRPLLAFGLLEHRSDPIPGERFARHDYYRKSPLFDRFLTFNVKLDAENTIRH